MCVATNGNTNAYLTCVLQHKTFGRYISDICEVIIVKVGAKCRYLIIFILLKHFHTVKTFPYTFKLKNKA